MTHLKLWICFCFNSKHIWRGVYQAEWGNHWGGVRGKLYVHLSWFHNIYLCYQSYKVRTSLLFLCFHALQCSKWPLDQKSAARNWQIAALNWVPRTQPYFLWYLITIFELGPYDPIQSSYLPPAQRLAFHIDYGKIARDADLSADWTGLHPLPFFVEE